MRVKGGGAQKNILQIHKKDERATPDFSDFKEKETLRLEKMKEA